jgi:hypothetical protein
VSALRPPRDLRPGCLWTAPRERAPRSLMEARAQGMLAGDVLL